MSWVKLKVHEASIRVNLFLCFALVAKCQVVRTAPSQCWQGPQKRSVERPPAVRQPKLLNWCRRPTCSLKQPMQFWPEKICYDQGCCHVRWTITQISLSLGLSCLHKAVGEHLHNRQTCLKTQMLLPVWFMKSSVTYIHFWKALSCVASVVSCLHHLHHDHPHEWQHRLLVHRGDVRHPQLPLLH